MALLKGVGVIGSQRSEEFHHQEQGNAGFKGHGSVVTALSVPRYWCIVVLRDNELTEMN